jgi:hypothetical protein
MDPEGSGDHEPEFRVISRVTDDDDDPVTEALALLESLFHKCGTDAQALEILVNGKWRKGKRCGFGCIGDDCYRGKEDMTDDPVTEDCDQGEFRVVIPVAAEGIDEPGLAILPECLEIDLKNGVDITGLFRADKK